MIMVMMMMMTMPMISKFMTMIITNVMMMMTKKNWGCCKACYPVHYGFCPLVKLTFKDLAKLTAFAAIFKTKSYFR